MALTNLEFFLVVPKEATNLVTNPSMEVATTGYTATGAGVSLTYETTKQRRGVACLRVNTAASVVAGTYFATISLANSTQYSFSADVLDVAGQTFNLFIADNSGNILSTNVTWIGNGYWKRMSVTYTTVSAAVHRLYVTRSSVASTVPFYVDGFQLEVGAVSTYLDGDILGFTRDINVYGWLGSPHASSSFRTVQTRSGGTEVRIKDYLKITAVLGLGLAPVLLSTIPNASGGSFYQGMVYDQRTISLKGEFIGNTPGEIYAKKKALVAAINPEQVSEDQPILLKIKGFDASGVEQMDTVDARVQYSGGLEGSSVTPGIEAALLQFQLFLPYVSSDGSVATSIPINETVVDTDYALFRDPLGKWFNISTSLSAKVDVMSFARDGSVFIGGDFQNIGDANGDRITLWNPVSGTFTSLGTGMQANGVIDLAQDAAGNLYALGQFTTAGGVANTGGVAKWDGSAWSALGAGMSGLTLREIAVGHDGTVYVVGGFTDFIDANGDRITKWNGSAWSSFVAGADNTVETVEVAPNGTVWFGGYFTTIGGITVGGLAVYDPIANTWSSVGGVTGTSPNIFKIVFDDAGNTYVCGQYVSIGGVTSGPISKWNGSSWTSISDGLTYGGGTISVGYLYWDPNTRLLYAMGNFDKYGTVDLANKLAAWNGSSWVPLDVNLPGGSPTWIGGKAGRFYVGISIAGNSMAPDVTAVVNPGSSLVYPKFVFTGPGNLKSVKNTTTGKSIWINLLLLAGETATLNLDPQRVTFVSNFRGNILNTVQAGSNLDLSLLPGTNQISVFIDGTTTGATTAGISFIPGYLSIDGALH